MTGKKLSIITKIMTGRQSDMIEPSRPADYAEAKLKTAVKCLMYFFVDDGR